MRFDGSDYVPTRDRARLLSQLERIRSLMRDGAWRTLGEIASASGSPESSVSAQLRHLRKPRFGSWRVEKRHAGNGLFEYRLLPHLPSGQQELFRITRPTCGRVG